MSRITVVGVGPGDPDLLTLKGRDTIQGADVVAGFETVLAPVRRWITGEVLPLRYADQDARLDDLAARAREGWRCVVCAWGDVNFSARELIDRVRARVDEVALVPGVSSVQVACARLGLDMERSVFITLHARDGVEQALCEAVNTIRDRRRHAILLPRPWDLMPAAVARELITRGVGTAAEVHVLERLTLPGERMRAFSLTSLAVAEEAFQDLSILMFPVPA